LKAIDQNFRASLRTAEERPVAGTGSQGKRGATICKDLKGIKADTVLCPCPECVRNAVLTLGAG